MKQNNNTKLYNSVRNLNPSKSMFDMSHTRLFTGDMGLLYPVMVEDCIPGDVWNIETEAVLRFQPLVAPILHEVNLHVHYFFVPYRLLWQNWEEFISGGEDGTYVANTPKMCWYDGEDAKYYPYRSAVGSLWDYLGFPVKADGDNWNIVANDLSGGQFPSDFPRRAYNLIWDEYYRDQNLQDPVTQPTDYVNNFGSETSNDDILRRNWHKDYFTSSLPFQQRGVAPALPISGIASTSFDMPDIAEYTKYSPAGGLPALTAQGSPNDPHVYINDMVGAANAQNALSTLLNQGTVDLSDASTFNVSDLRLAFQVQKWLERNARSGVRYTEFLKAHYGVSPQDSRLQRPEYIGGIKNPVIVSEVLQTGETGTTPQGNMAGHGISVASQKAGTYKVEEYGIIMGLLSVMPTAMYQQGLDRIWTKDSKYDYYFPEFMNLSEQAIMNQELFFSTNKEQNVDMFGYQGRYDEYRQRSNKVCGKMRDLSVGNFSYWHMARNFETLPELNSSFIQCVPDKSCFAAPSEEGLIIHVSNVCKALRPLPVIAEPGMIDHN